MTVVAFLVLGWIGTRIYQEIPPLPGIGYNVVRWKASEIQRLIDTLPKAG